MRGAPAGGKSVRKNYGRQYVCRPYIFELTFSALYLLNHSAAETHLTQIQYSVLSGTDSPLRLFAYYFHSAAGQNRGAGFLQGLAVADTHHAVEFALLWRTGDKVERFAFYNVGIEHAFVALRHI